MNLSEKGISLIKKFEGCHLTAYLCPAGKWTIGYGHTAGVVKGMKITQEQADEYLRQDCKSSEKAVNAMGRVLNQNQFDALVSFTFNCGVGNLKTLCQNRSLEVIGEKLLLYTKAGGRTLNGLVKRRKEEQALFLAPVETGAGMAAKESHSGISAGLRGQNKPVLRMGSRGEDVKEVQKFLSLKGIYHGAIDGIFGALTKQAVIEWQGYCEIAKDGVVGKNTWATMG